MRALIRCIAAAVVAAAATTAFADGTVPSYVPGSHTLTGDVPAGDEHYVPMDLPAGTLLTLICKADKKQKSTLLPNLVLVGPDGVDVPIANPKIHAKKGWSAKNVPLSLTGRYVVVVTGRDGTGGGYLFKAKAKLPKSFSGERDFGTGPFEIEFPATLGAKVGFTVAGKKGQTLPSSPRVARPDGQAFGPPKLAETKTGVKAKPFEQSGELGTYKLQFQLRPGTEAGTRVFKYKIVVKFPKAKKAKYTYDDLIVAPLVTGFTPQELSGNNENVTVTATGRFFQNGTEIELQFGGERVQVAGESVVPGGMQGIVNPFGMPPGGWDVVAISPSGGEYRLKAYVNVLPAQPKVALVDPTIVRDDVLQRTLLLSGTNLNETSVITFRLPLPGSSDSVITPLAPPQPIGGAQVSVTVNLFHRAIGVYDVEVFNKGPSAQFDSALETTEDIFRIINAPPTIESFAPGCVETNDPLAVTIDGLEMEAGARVFLQHDPDGDGIVDAEVEGTSVTVDVAGVQATADFDMTGQAPGVWSVLWRNPDGQESSIDDVLFTVDGLPMALTDASVGQPDVAFDAEDDLALIVWVETDENAQGSGTLWKVMGRLFDTSTNAFSGAAFRISDSTKDAQPKRTASAAYNTEADEWLVVWCEHTFATLVLSRQNAGLTPSSGTVYQVYGRRVDTNGVLSGAEIDFINHDTSISGQWYDEFEYWNPQVVYAPWDGNWYLTMTQEWDTDTSGREDYDVYIWRVSATSPGFDSGWAHALHTTQNHEGDALTEPNFDTQEFFVVGACDSRQLSSQGPRDIEGKIVSSSGSILPGTGGSNVGDVYAVTSRGGSENEDFDHPRTAYGYDFGEYLVVYERTDEGGSGNKEIRGQLVDSSSRSRVGGEIVIATDADHDLLRPRVVYNSGLREYLVTWTVDDTTDDESHAMARHIPAGTPSNAGGPIPLGCAGSGYPVAHVDPVTDEYIVVFFKGYDALNAVGERSGTELLVRRIP